MVSEIMPRSQAVLPKEHSPTRQNAFWKGVFVVLILALLGWLLWPGAFPVRQVRIGGELHHLSRQVVQRLVEAESQRGFFEMDLDRMHRVLQQHPWINQISIRRSWPDRLLISIREERPLVRWGKLGFLNREGHLVVLEGGLQDGSLPLLQGPPGSHVQVLRLFGALHALLAPQDLHVRKLRLNEHRSWSMELSNGWVVMLGRSELDRRMDRFAHVSLPVLNAQARPVETIDMRYSNGYAVRWGDRLDIVNAGEIDEKG